MHDNVVNRTQIRRVAQGGIAAFAIYMVGVGLAYCSQLAIARLVSAEAYGIYAYVLAWVSVLAYFSALGFVAPDRVVRDGVLLALVLIATLGLRWHVDASFVMMATLVSSAVALGTVATAVRRLQPSVLADVVPAYAASTWRLVALPLVVIGVTEVLMNRTGVLLLGWIGDTTSAGVYSLAFSIAFVVTLPRTAVNTLFAPMVSSLFTRKEQAMLQLLITKSSSWTLCAAVLIGASLFVFAEPLLAWLGKEYVAGVPALRILLVGQVIAAGAGSQMHVMTMTGNERGAATLLIAGALGNIITGAALIDLFGLVGAAIASTITLIVWNVAMALFIWRRLHLLSGVLALFR
jgi:O-antigen/teichoic acid export membrane protein